MVQNNPQVKFETSAHNGFEDNLFYIRCRTTEDKRWMTDGHNPHIAHTYHISSADNAKQSKKCT